MNVHDADRLRELSAKLPAATREKIEQLIFQSTAAHGALSSASDLLRLAQSAYAENRQRILRGREFEETMTPSGPVYRVGRITRHTPDQDEIDRITAPIVAGWRDVQRHKAMVDKLRPAWEAHAFLTELQYWLGSNPGPHRAANLPSVKSKDHAAAVAEIREKLAVIEDKMSATETAPLTLKELQDAAAGAIDYVATRAAPAIYMESRSPVAVRDDAGFIIWALRDTIKAAVNKELADRHDGQGLSLFDRAAELSALAAEKLSLERLEEAHITAAAMAGQTIERRRDADPRAVLEIE